MMDERDRRLAQNEALFREVNERIDEQAASLGGEHHLYEFFCECSNADCTFAVRMTLRDYEFVRTSPRWFFVKPGHDLPEVERVIDRRDGFWIVEKGGEAAAYVERLDPRSRGGGGDEGAG